MWELRKDLTTYLLTVEKLDCQAERLRTNILQNRFYQCATVFERIDKFNKGYLVPQDFAEFMLDNCVYPSQNQLYLIFRDFDPQQNGLVRVTDFQHQISPKHNSLLCEQAASRKYYSPKARLEIDLEFHLAKYFQHKIKEINCLSALRLQMHQKKTYSVDLAFDLLSQKEALFSLQLIDKFLRSNGKKVEKIVTQRIFKKLSFNTMQAVNFQTFLKHFDPMARGFYPSYNERIIQKNILHRTHLQKQYAQSRRIQQSLLQQDLIRQRSELLQQNRKFNMR